MPAAMKTPPRATIASVRREQGILVSQSVVDGINEIRAEMERTGYAARKTADREARAALPKPVQGRGQKGGKGGHPRTAKKAGAKRASSYAY